MRLITAVVCVADGVTRLACLTALRRLRRVRVVADVRVAPDAFTATQALAPDVVLLSTDLAPRLLGPLREVTYRGGLATRILLVGQPCSEAAMLDALAAGARGHVPHCGIAEQLGRAIQVVAEGEVWCSRALVPHLLERLFGAGALRCPPSQYPLVQ